MDQIYETKRLLQWIGKNSSCWDIACANNMNGVSYFDCIVVIKELREKRFYTQILNLVSKPENEMRHMMFCTVTEKMVETWGQKEWDDVIEKIICQLEESHQNAKRRRSQHTEMIKRAATQ